MNATTIYIVMERHSVAPYIYGAYPSLEEAEKAKQVILSMTYNANPCIRSTELFSQNPIVNLGEQRGGDDLGISNN